MTLRYRDRARRLLLVVLATALAGACTDEPTHTPEQAERLYQLMSEAPVLHVDLRGAEPVTDVNVFGANAVDGPARSPANAFREWELMAARQSVSASLIEEWRAVGATFDLVRCEPKFGALARVRLEDLNGTVSARFDDGGRLIVMLKVSDGAPDPVVAPTRATPRGIESCPPAVAQAAGVAK